MTDNEALLARRTGLAVVTTAIAKAGGVMALAEQLAHNPETIIGWLKHPERTLTIEKPALEKMRKMANGNGETAKSIPSTARKVQFTGVNGIEGSTAFYGVGVIQPEWINVFIPNAKVMQLRDMGVEVGGYFMADLETGRKDGFKLSVENIYS
jgi:hypothetical protein